MYQVGALSALEDALEGLDGRGFDLYIGTSSGATVAAALAGDCPFSVFIARCSIRPTTTFRSSDAHLTELDLDEWRRTIVTRSARSEEQRPQPHFAHALAQGSVGAARPILRFASRRASSPSTLSSASSKSSSFGEASPTAFRAWCIPCAWWRTTSTRATASLRRAGYDDVPSRARCCASTALPLFYSPVRIRDRHYIDGGVGRVGHLDVAESEGADLVVLVNPMVPVRAETTGVPTGHGARPSVRDKGLMWVYNQAMRIGVHARLHYALDGAAQANGHSLRARTCASPCCSSSRSRPTPCSSCTTPRASLRGAPFSNTLTRPPASALPAGLTQPYADRASHFKPAPSARRMSVAPP